MKRYLIVLLLVAIFVTLPGLAEEAEVDLTQFGRDELNAITADIDEEIERHHETDSSSEAQVLAATKKVVVSWFTEKGIEISWAWINYTYTRDWDFYTLSTHIDYSDENDTTHKDDVYAEVLCEDDDYNVYYLTVGDEVILDRREELPEEHWSQQPESFIEPNTGLELSTMSIEELGALRDRVTDEYRANHNPSSTVSDLVLSLARLETESIYAKQEAEVSWAWFNYDYTRDWDFYTLSTPISVRDAQGSSRSVELYAEAYPFDGQYALCYLSLDDDVYIDRRDELPESLVSEVTAEAQSGTTGDAEEEIENKQTDGASATADAQGATEAGEQSASTDFQTYGEVSETADNTSEADLTAKSTVTTAPTLTPEPTPTPQPVRIGRGDKNDDVKALQQRLIALAYLDDVADGNFGQKTEAAVRSFQEAEGMEATGIVTEVEQAKMQDELQALAVKAIEVVMTNDVSVDVFTSDGNGYDPDKFHDYSYTDGLYAQVKESGKWTTSGMDAWHVENMRLQIVGQEDDYMKISADIRFDGEQYVFSHVEVRRSRLAYLDSDDMSKINEYKIDSTVSNPYLIVSPSMLRGERKSAQNSSESVSTSSESTEDTERQAWIDSQFSIWNGAHKGLQDLIKDSLNDEGSYKHISTEYIDVSDKATCDRANDVLKGSGFSQRVEIGDLLIMTEFSAKNYFNARIKYTALGIVSYKDNTVELIGIE